MAAADRRFVGVYFVLGTGSGLVKIGFTTADPRKRLKELQWASPDRLELLGVIRGPLPLEGLLHKRFARSLDHGEWFRLTPMLEEFLDHGIDPWPEVPNVIPGARTVPDRVYKLRQWAEAEAVRIDSDNPPGYIPGWRRCPVDLRDIDFSALVPDRLAAVKDRRRK